MVAAETEKVLGAGGGAGISMSSIDWAATPLGHIRSWSPTLRTMVEVVLHSPFPLSLWWGPELVQLYNDAYRPILGDKHPRAMAQRAKECFREAWGVLGPMLEAPLRGEAATTSEDLLLLLERKGFLEEAHFKVAYSPVPDNTVGATGVGGVLGTCVEITEQVYRERQLRTLRELRVRAADAKTAEEACVSAAAALGENTWDVPFALLYLFDENGKRARLVSNVGFGSSRSRAALAVVERAADDASSMAWPLGPLVRGRTHVFEGIDAHLGPLPCGRWPISPHAAVAISLESTEEDQPYGALICGLSPHRALEAGYRGFFELAAAQITTMIRSARAHGEEHHVEWTGRASAFAKEAECWEPDVIPPWRRPPLRGGANPWEPDVRILVADDNVDMREHIARTLRERWTVMAVADGEAALETARDWQPELVLTEVLMPGLSGFGLLSELRKDARTRACPVMMVSARAGDARLDGLEAGACDYITKPFAARELVARVSTQVQLARRRKQADAERARLFSFLMQLPVAVAACEGPNHVLTLKNPLVEPLTQGRLRLGDALSDICLELSLPGLVEVLDRVYSSGEPGIWKCQPLSIERDGGGNEERLFDITLQPLRDVRGTVAGIVAAACEVNAPLSARRRNGARGREVAVAMAREQAENVAATLSSMLESSAEAPVYDTPPQPDVVTQHVMSGREVEPAELRPSGEASVDVVRDVAWASVGVSEPQRRPGDTRRVLVVDDDRDAAALMEEALVELGFSVAVAYDAPSALLVAKSFHPDTALVDVGLPIVDGLELGRWLREAEEVPGVLRLVAITGFGRESDRVRSQQAGFDLHLVKPVALGALSGAVIGGRRPPFASACQ